METPICTVVEVAPFSTRAADVWSEEERHDFIDYIARNPEAGAVIPRTNGLRKVRWAIKGQGKRGGARVIYYYHTLDVPLFLLTVYSKSANETLSKQQEQAIAKLVPLLLNAYNSGEIK